MLYGVGRPNPTDYVDVLLFLGNGNGQEKKLSTETTYGAVRTSQ
jgi:hypothetical protein